VLRALITIPHFRVERDYLEYMRRCDPQYHFV